MVGPNTLRAVLRLRSLAFEYVDEEIDRLERLVGNGQLARFDLDVWGDRIAVDRPDAAGSPVLETFEEMERWAVDRGYSLLPAFERRTTGSMVAEDGREIVVVPLRCLTIYDRDELRTVYPYADGETVYTVADGLEALETTLPHAPLATQADDDSKSVVEQ